uniref:non-specific serine/threonine protein kinase n=1 Tax=Strongyloides papillosus TaxID=174720 RepID=A0A0N5C2C2_STREA
MPRPKRVPLIKNTSISCNGNTYKIEKILGFGGCGDVYSVVDENGDYYAMKTELYDKIYHKKLEKFLKKGSMNDENCPAPNFTERLPLENKILKELCKKEETNDHFTIIVGDGIYKNYRFMIMEMVGPSLDDLRKKYGVNNCLSVSTTIRLAWQCLEGIKYLHQIGFIHRDIKPHNYTCGRGKYKDTVYLLDFGIAKRYKGKSFKEEPPEKTMFIGTVRYASRNSHKLLKQLPYDDVEAWCYSIVEIMDHSTLKWRREKSSSRVYNMKREFFMANRRGPDFNKIVPVKFNQCLDLIDYHRENQIQEFKYYKIHIILREIIDEAGFNVNDPFEWEKSEK